MAAVQAVQTSLIYITRFGIGSTTDMALRSVAIAVPRSLTAARGLGWLHQRFTGALGAFSCMLDALMTYRIAIIRCADFQQICKQLFAGTPILRGLVGLNMQLSTSAVL